MSFIAPRVVLNVSIDKASPTWAVVKFTDAGIWTDLTNRPVSFLVCLLLHENLFQCCILFIKVPTPIYYFNLFPCTDIPGDGQKQALLQTYN